MENQRDRKKKNIKLEKALSNPETEYSEIAKFVSLEKVYESGSAAFIDVLKFAPGEVRDEAINAYANSPIDGMKYAIAYDLKNNITPKDVKNKDNVSRKRSEIIKYMGLESPSVLDLTVGINTGFGDYEMGSGIDADITILPFVWGGLGANYIHFFKGKLNIISFGPTVRIPLNFNKFYIISFGKAEAGLALQGANIYSQLKLNGGMEVLFNYEDKYKYGLGVSYGILKFNKFGSFYDNDNFFDKNISNIVIYGKLCL